MATSSNRSRFSPLLRLPVELQGEIVSYLPFIDQHSVALTCPELRECVLSLRYLRYIAKPAKVSDNKDLSSPSPSPPEKTHILLQTPVDSDPSTTPSRLFCSMQYGKIKEYLYHDGGSSDNKPGSPLGGQINGYIWGGEKLILHIRPILPSETLKDLGFEEIFDPELQESGGETNYIIHPHNGKNVTLFRGVVDISDSPLLDEPCFLYRPHETDERSEEKENMIGVFKEVAADQEPEKTIHMKGIPFPERGKGWRFRSVVRATKNLTVRQLLRRMVKILYKEMTGALGPFDEVFIISIQPQKLCRFHKKTIFEASAIALMPSRDLQDMIWVPDLDGGDKYTIMPRKVVEEAKQACI
ncbi:hypothetical protein TWF506_007338 [Arthrobotrys conoides]|uniref:F-box domain-containing protein n=1 Tax=Arthrobotrys conoides TaxID=74498 RepID=A0AAN8RXY0_9PEZI